MTPTQKGLSSAIRQTYRTPRPLRAMGWVLFFACGLAMGAILLSDPMPARVPADGPAGTEIPATAAGGTAAAGPAAAET